MKHIHGGDMDKNYWRRINIPLLLSVFLLYLLALPPRRGSLIEGHLLPLPNAGESVLSVSLAAQTSQGPQCVEPTWPVPTEGATIVLSKTRVDRPGEQIAGLVIVRDLRLLQDRHIPHLGSLLLILEIIQTREVVRFAETGNFFLEHTVDPRRIAAGTYTFPIQLVGFGEGDFQLALGWKWRIFTEGACSVAINGVYAGCRIGGALNAECVCRTLADLPAPGSWACKVHPLTFRAAWALWGCPGPSPY